MIDLFTRSEDRTLFVSVLAALEVRSAIRRRERLGDTDPRDASRAIGILVQETRRIIEHPITAPVIAQATDLVDRHQLRALDSIQLATAFVQREVMAQGQQILFVASNHRLLRAAESEGFSTWDPAGKPSTPADSPSR